MLTVGSLFSGIGGFELGLERTGGFKTVWQCEIDEFCQKVLAKHWPDVQRFSDIKEMNGDVPHVDVICGGFPCQPVSVAGKRKGDCDERWLWPEFFRVVCEVNPTWVLVENVPGLLSADSGRIFGGILRDLSRCGYDAEWNIISAANVGAPHLRKRVFIVAYSQRIGLQSGGEAGHLANKSSEIEGITQERGRRGDAFNDCGSDVAHTHSKPSQPPIGNLGQAQALVETIESEQDSSCTSRTSRETTNTNNPRRVQQWWEKSKGPIQLEYSCGGDAEPGLGIFADGLSEGLDDYWKPGWEDGTPRLTTDKRDRKKRLKSLGNAIVPQCAEYVGRCVLLAIDQGGY